MPRTEVYQLRLTPEEKGRLARLAQEKELSIAGMIREDYGLDAPPGREPEPVDERPTEASVEEPRPVGSSPVPTAAGPRDKARLKFKTRELEGKGNRPDKAREMAVDIGKRAGWWS